MDSGDGYGTLERTRDGQDGSVAVGYQIWLLARLALPSVLSELCVLFVWTLSSGFVGRHLGTTALAGVSLANLSGNILGFSLINGMLSAYDTLGPQSFAVGKYDQVGILAQRSLLICTVLGIFLGVVWWNMDSLLLQLGEDPNEAALAGEFLRVLILGLPGIIFSEVLKRFLVAQSIVWPFVYVGVFVTMLHYFWLQVFVIWMNLGFKGTPICHVVSYCSVALFGVIYVAVGQPHQTQTWNGFASLAQLIDSSSLRVFLRLGVPGVLSNSEWWFWEIIAMVAGKLGVVEFAAHSVAYNVVPIAFMLPLGLEIGATVRIASLVSTHRAKTARLLSNVCLALGLLIGIFNAFVCYLFRDHIIQFFTNDVEVVSLCHAIWPHVLVFLVLNACFEAQVGVIQGLGKQLHLSIVLVICLWVTGFPSILFLRTLNGIWIGLNCIYAVVNIGLFVVICEADFTSSIV